MEPRPRPFLGAALGLLLGIVGVSLAWQLGWLAPTRLVLFLGVAVATLAVSALLTRSVSAARGRFVTVAVMSGILAGVALTGIPEQFRSGSISEGCTLQASVGGEVVTPSDTSAFDPLAVTADDVIPWSAMSDTAIAVTERVAGIRVGGFDIPVNTVAVEGASEVQEVAGEVDVAQTLAWVEDNSGLEISGTYAAYGSISGDGGECAVDGYVRLAPASVYATNVLKGLWIALGVLLILIAWGALAVRKSFTDAEDARREADRVYSGSVTTGGTASGAASGHVAGDADHSGVTAPEEAPRPDDAPARADADAATHDGDAAGEGDDRIVPTNDEGPEPASEDEDSDPKP